mmetsp:Transcript_125180/g.221855  ORF Transcript_125180/g.221855 Transcript_125180/m.221855 type:complete len:307 (+) Transcript_125180:380-1300(+)
MIVEASRHETGLHLGVGFEAVLLWDLLDHMECLAKLLAPTVHLHHNAKSHIGGCDSKSLHVFQKSVGQVHAIVPDTAIQQRVVDYRIRGHLVLLHVSQNFKGLIKVSSEAVTFHNGGVSDAVWRAAMRCHALHQEAHVVHGTDPGLSIDDCVVNHVVHGHLHIEHFTPHVHGTRGLPRVRKALDQCRIDNRVRWNLWLPFLEQYHCFFGALVTDKRVEHAAKNDIIGIHATVAHHDVPELPALVQALQSAAGLYKTAVNMHAWLDAGLAEGIDDILKTTVLTMSDARLEHCVEQHLIGAYIQPGAV